LMLLTDPMKYVTRRADRVVEKNLAKFHFGHNEIGMILFGNSLLNQSFQLHPRILRRKFFAEMKNAGYQGKRINPVEITRGGMNAFRLQSLADEMIATGPAIFLIQSEMFVARHRKISVKEQAANRFATWSGLMNLQLFGAAEFHRRPDQKNKNRMGVEVTDRRRFRPNQPRQSQLRAKALWSNQVASNVHPEFVAALGFVQKASALGIRVIVIELPVSETAAKFATGRYFHERSEAIQQLTKLGVIRMIYPRTLSDHYFTDYSHLNRKGRDEFIRWFFPALAQALVKNEVVG
jgi:hypothetical protein